MNKETVLKRLIEEENKALEYMVKYQVSGDKEAAKFKKGLAAGLAYARLQVIKIK